MYAIDLLRFRQKSIGVNPKLVNLNLAVAVPAQLQLSLHGGWSLIHRDRRVGSPAGRTFKETSLWNQKANNVQDASVDENLRSLHKNTRLVHRIELAQRSKGRLFVEPISVEAAMAAAVSVVFNFMIN